MGRRHDLRHLLYGLSAVAVLIALYCVAVLEQRNGDLGPRLLRRQLGCLDPAGAYRGRRACPSRGRERLGDRDPAIGEDASPPGRAGGVAADAGRTRASFSSELSSGVWPRAMVLVAAIPRPSFLHSMHRGGTPSPSRSSVLVRSSPSSSHGSWWKRTSRSTQTCTSGPSRCLVVGAIAWGARVGDFTMFYLFFAGIAVIATPVAAVAVRTAWERLRATGHARLAAGLVVLCAIQLEFGVVKGEVRLQTFGRLGIRRYRSRCWMRSGNYPRTRSWPMHVGPSTRADRVYPASSASTHTQRDGSCRCASRPRSSAR